MSYRYESGARKRNKKLEAKEKSVLKVRKLASYFSPMQKTSEATKSGTVPVVKGVKLKVQWLKWGGSRGICEG